MGSHQPIRKVVTPDIPDKLYFRIGDVAKLCDVPTYVLRFWETEFSQLKPNKGGTGQRLYRKRDVEMAMRIKSLLYDQGYTIPGARQVFKAEFHTSHGEGIEPVDSPVAMPLREEPPRTHASASSVHRETQIQALRNELSALLGMLSRPVSATSHAAPAPSKVKAMRPRLVLEPRPTPVAVPDPPRLRLEQRDLFGELPETTE